MTRPRHAVYSFIGERIDVPQTTHTDRFKESILKMEADRDVQPLVALFADHAKLDAPARHEPLIGCDGATEFWTEYLESFKSVRSRFTREHILGDTAVLEWQSSGTLLTGRPIEYRGVSIVRFKEQKIESFTAYYDSAAFVTDAAGTLDASHGTNNEGGD